MKNSNVLLPVVIVTLTGMTLLLSARHENINAAEGGVVVKVAAPPAEGDDAIESTAEAIEAAGPAKALNPVKLSYGLDEIAKMVEAGIEPEVIEAFIDNSTIAYAANAGDIVRLRELGAHPGVLASLIRHGGRLREQGTREFKEAQATLSRQATTVASPADNSLVPAQPAQPAVVSINNSSYAYPAFMRPDYPVYDYAGPQYVRVRSYNYSYPRFGFQRQYFPAFYSSCRPHITYNHCAPRFVRPAVTIGFHAPRHCRPGAGLRVGIRR